MYNAIKLQEAFAGLVGFYQPYDPAYQVLEEILQQSTSGIFIQGQHPLVSLENLQNAAPEFKLFTYPLWSAATAYMQNQIVTYNAETYRSKTTHDANVALPSADAVNWVKIKPFSAWLLDQYNAGVRMMFSDLVRMKKLDSANKQLLDSLILFDGMGSYSDSIFKQNRFVGYSLDLSKQEGLAVQISKIGFQMRGEQELTFYLYHSSQVEPIATFPQNFNKNGSFQWKLISDAILNYAADGYNTEGRFYLGYYEEDLEGTNVAISRASSWGTAPCIGCSDWNYKSWERWSKHVRVNAFYVSSFTKGEMFDENRITWAPSTNWGMNLAITVTCDLTNFYTYNKSSLADALAMAVTVKLLEQIGFTTRLTGIADVTKGLALKELSIEDKDSFYNRYLSELEAVSVDFSGMSSDCMPCRKDRGIIMGAI